MWLSRAGNTLIITHFYDIYSSALITQPNDRFIFPSKLVSSGVKQQFKQTEHCPFSLCDRPGLTSNNYCLKSLFENLCSDWDNCAWERASQKWYLNNKMVYIYYKTNDSLYSVWIPHSAISYSITFSCTYNKNSFILTIALQNAVCHTDTVHLNTCVCSNTQSAKCTHTPVTYTDLHLLIFTRCSNAGKVSKNLSSRKQPDSSTVMWMQATQW